MKFASAASLLVALVAADHVAAQLVCDEGEMMWEFDYVFVPDAFPDESSIELVNTCNGNVIHNFDGDIDAAEEGVPVHYEQCLDYNSEYSITLFDSFGDGIDFTPEAGFTVTWDGNVILDVGPVDFGSSVGTTFGEGCSCVGQCMGDPHFQVWSGEWFDFHGQCDLTYLTEPSFGGVGLDIQIRTSPRYEFSFIESAAIKIGDDVLEIGSWGEYFLNGVEFSGAEAVDMPDMKLASRYSVSHTQVNKKRHIFEVDLLEKGQKIIVTTYKDIVAIKMAGATAKDFKNSRGILGEFGTGRRLGRNGIVIDDDNAFGQDWQVHNNETMLFQTARQPQYPMTCVMPSAKSEARRLGQTVAEAQARSACDHWDADMQEQCIFDVMATGDLELAELAPGAY